MKGYCRVGFDGGSTLHNFTARSEEIDGAFTLRLDELTDGPGGALTLSVDTLDSDNDARDEEIHSHLAAGDDHTIRCELLSFEKGRPGPEGRILAKAKVRFTIHGKSRVVTAPIELQYTDRQLLHVKGETKLRMSDFGIEPKAKLGVIKVYDELTAWWDLYAEVDRASR
jgi:polyisoprenoid-binding protein YceI